MLEVKAKDTNTSVLQKKALQNFFSGDLKKKRSSKIFSGDFQKKKNGLENNFSADLQNFNHSQNSAVLEPRTSQFSRS